MAGLRGKVVRIDFWTYPCINCLRMLPYVTRWHDAYKDRGLVVVGVHTPEFGFERITANVQRAIGRFGTRCPVAQDNAMASWRAYSNPAENATLAHGGGAVNLAFQSGKVFMVANSERPVAVVVVDGRPQPPVTVQGSRLHTLFDSGDYGQHVMTISIPKAGFEAFTFTFG